MKSLSKIILASEFSSTCECAREHAQALALRSGAELHVVHVQVLHGDQFGWAGIPDIKAVERAMDQMSDTRMARFVSGLDGAVTQVVMRDISASPAILRYAAEQQADLIVMGTHSRKGMDRLFMGSVASEVIRRSEVPVLAIGPEQHHPEDGYQRLLAAVDFSPSSDAALRQARAMALEHQADVIAQHVIDDRSLPPYFQGDFIEPQRESARLAMQQLLRTLDAPPRIDPVISTGKPAPALVEAARAHAVDLIVVGDAGLSALDRFFLGSTADRLLRVATCPVLVHRGDIIGNL